MQIFNYKHHFQGVQFDFSSENAFLCFIFQQGYEIFC